MITVPVELKDHGYEVLIGRGARHALAAAIRARLPSVRRAMVVTQQPLIDAGWVQTLDPGVPFEVTVVAGGEGAKTFSSLEALVRGFARAELNRDDVVVAAGGGTVTDLAGFAAAIFHRGMPYVNVASTLLGQVDAAIGGKTGVNVPEGKNLVGAFWQPAAVLCDTELLDSLPPREWACGRGEMAKYAFLGSGTPDGSILELPLADQVAQCVRIKAAVVGADERDHGHRAVLNYGHTLAHALEALAFEEGAASVPDLRHGEAVAIGLVFAALLARRLGRIDDERVELHRHVVERFGLRAELPPGIDPQRLLALIARDKKAHHDLSFVLDGPRGVEVVHGVSEDDVLATLAQMGSTQP